jgi:DNA-binding response OmpR family regulator
MEAALKTPEPIEFDGDRCFVRGKPVPLTWAQASAVRVMASIMPALAPKEALRAALATQRSWEPQVSDNVLRVQIHRIRKKLRPFGLQVMTRHGSGYGLYWGRR